jgi:hypothetical protein
VEGVVSLNEPPRRSRLNVWRRRNDLTQPGSLGEYEAEFTEDLDVFLLAAWVDKAVMRGRDELPPCDDIRYIAAVDPAGWGRRRLYLAIVHAEGKESEPPNCPGRHARVEPARARIHGSRRGREGGRGDLQTLPALLRSPPSAATDTPRRESVTASVPKGSGTRNPKAKCRTTRVRRATATRA